MAITTLERFKAYFSATIIIALLLYLNGAGLQKII
jgi:hypothetical protein